jgi:signal transduction histidine kinase
VAETRSPIVVERALASRDPKHAMIRSVGLDAYASFPLVADGELIGVVSFGTRTRDAFAPEEIAILQTIASYCAIALQRRRLLETLEREVAERGHAAARGEQAAVRARRAVARLQRLHAITEAALVDVPLPELLGNLLPQIRSALAADNATVLLLSPDGDALTPVASDGLLEEVKAAVRVPLGDGVAGRIAVSAAGMIFDDLSQVDVKSPLLAERVTSLAGVPLHAGDELIGVLHVGAARARVFTGEDLDFLRVVADSAALAIERVRLRGFERAARAEAEAASRAKDEFLAMLGHELRNPLGAIRTASALLDRIGSNERKAVLARDVIARQVRHLARLVDDLLDVARVMRGKIAMERRPLDLAAAVQRHLDVLRADGRLELHRLETRLDSVMIDADPVRLDQVVGNLLTNALKYTPPGGTITITVCRDPDAGVLRVADTGIGIAADLLPQIFDLFVQSERALDRSQGGLGVGLTLVRRLVVAHGGRVEAESEGPGRGAKFTVWWPLAIRGASRPPDGEPPPTRAGTIKRIVVVEDNTDSRQMFVELLEAAGHEVYWAEDGRPALDLLRRIQADVAFIDIGLPGLDGYEVARRLRAEPGGRKTMLVAVTGYGQAEDRERALAAGFDAHLVKPVDPAALEAVLLDANRT